MRRFILKTCLFLLPLILIGLLLEILIRNIPNDYSYKKEYLDKNSNNIETLFLGSSHAYFGINPELIIGNSFNAAHIAQSIDYDYEIIKKYQNKWNQLKTIVIPIDYQTLFSRVATSEEPWRVKNYQIYYNINKSYQLSDNLELFSIKLSLNLKRITAYYINNKSEITCSNLGYFNGKDSHGNLDMTGVVAAKRHTVPSNLFYKKNISVLNQIIDFGAKENIKIIFYTSPAYKTYTSNLDSKQLDLTINIINKLVNKNSNCYYYNFLEDGTFKGTDYRDADHLNKSGAKKLTQKINEIIYKQTNALK